MQPSEAEFSGCLTAPSPFDLQPLETSGQPPATQPDVLEFAEVWPPLLRGHEKLEARGKANHVRKRVT